jgi:hypothetical protein
MANRLLSMISNLKEHLYQDHGLTRGHLGVVALPFMTHRVAHQEPCNHEFLDWGPVDANPSSEGDSRKV